ncbi:peptidase M16 [Siphonobacter sp. BAB-5405]|uniref:M16 family metallopeptidase n=1 Tax=Siphonobacter sp. BAB-5405 TaxID=1864825 RepID=UPI000C80FA33|nr:pitrilysin family protein [Siphonobacter sp. BAB-5405]PMD96217.1 peptidase M16 [Siphonobacter sp. BAB-5405]
MLKRFCMWGLAFWLSVPAFAQLKAEDVQSFTLKNGMKIFVLEDHSIPNANMYLFWNVGSRNEKQGITGLSHFFEHMMFNGAKKYGPKQFDQVMEFNGGQNNAYTSQDMTVYTDFFPATALESIFDLEADRIRDLALDPKMIESERGVVHSEYTTGLENSPEEELDQAMLSVAFSQHPYMWSVIGYESDILNWKREDLVNYFKTYYAPNNAITFIVGDVKLADVKRLAEQYFEPIPVLAPAPPVVHNKEPEQKGERRVMVNRDVPSPYVQIAYHTPEARHPDYYALDLLSAILSRGQSSRLYKALVDTQIASEAYTSFAPSIDPYLFSFTAQASDGKTADTLEAALLAEVDKVVKTGVTEAELEKVKNQKVMDFYRSIQTNNGKANTLGRYERYFGDYRKFFTASEDYRNVTVADIQRVAKTYFKKSNRTIGVLQKETE